MREHSYASNNYLISKAIRKYGWDNFQSSVLKETDDREIEKKFIREYQSNDPTKGYNLTDGGEGTVGYIPSEETREKMRAKKLGRKLTSEHCQKISESNKGRVFTTETREKISKKSKGRQTWLGKNLTEEHKEKLSKTKEKTWTVESPTGEVMTIINMRKFCLSNNLHSSAMSRVLHGKQSHHKGWKAYETS
jgi:group I intron endonuclease